MSAQARFDAAARKEFDSAVDWYTEREPQAALDFIAAFDSAVERIELHPRSGSPHLFGTRRVFLSGFPYEVVYLFAGEAVRVIAIAHAAQRPGYWRKRLP